VFWSAGALHLFLERESDIAIGAFAERWDGQCVLQERQTWVNVAMAVARPKGKDSRSGEICKGSS
jgi:hypothetical protein